MSLLKTCLRPRTLARITWGCISASTLIFASAANAGSQSETAPTSEVPSALVQLGTGEYYSPYAFVVDKKARQLTVWNQKDSAMQKVASFPVDFGRGGGKKLRKGDLNTPEGIYFLTKQLEGRELDFKQYGKRAFTTDYPNLFDQREGKTGDGIWLHAVPDDTPLTRGSRGCVVVRNDVILDLTKYVRLHQTPIVIFDQALNVPMQKRLELNTLLHKNLESWRTAWENKNMDSYISFYSNNFESLGMNRSKWQKFKTALAETYKAIQVKLSEPVIYRHDDEMVMRFLQAYQSDKKSDYGEKTLYWHHEDGQWKIVAEQWGEVSNPLAYHDLPPFEMSACADCKAGSTVAQGASSSQAPQ